jgi:Ran GTPase-activating protein (RanGAP) involved in mRNA processing and transport
MARTPRLPIPDAATRRACDQVADRLDLEVVDFATSMTSAVIDEVPEYAPFADKLSFRRR